MTKLAANLGCDRFRHHFQAFARHHKKLLCCSIRIWADALFWDRSSIKIHSFALDSIWNMLLCSYVAVLLRDQWMIKRLSKAMGAALVGNNLSLIPSKTSFQIFWKKQSIVTFQHLQTLKPFGLSNQVSIARVVERFSQASQSRSAATAADCRRPPVGLGNALCLHFISQNPKCQFILFRIPIITSVQSLVI